jgi:hypothetical protein
MTYRIHDNGIEREMTADEIKLYEKQLAETELNNANAIARANAKAAVLAKLGLTADEAAALLG